MSNLLIIFVFMLIALIGRILFKEITMNHAQLQAALIAISASVNKIGTETAGLLEQVATLNERIAQLDNVPQDIVDLVAAITDRANQIDELVPDVPATGGDTGDTGDIGVNTESPA